MVHDYAMGTAGVGRSPEGDVRLSETTLRIRDEERQDLIEEARRAAQKMIVSHRRQLDALAHELLEREVLEREAIERIMAGVPRLERAPGDRPAGRRRHRGRAGAASRPHRPPGHLGRATAARGYRLGPVFSRIDHIGVAVEEIEPAMALYRDSFQLGVAHREVVEEQGVEAVLLDVGENHVELLAPLGAETPVGKFLARQGPGLHHVAYQVEDIEATLEACRAAGLQLIDEQPRSRHPRLARGVHASARHGGRAHRDRPAGRRDGGPLMAGGARRISVGFQGGQVLALRVADDAAEGALRSVGQGRLAQVESEDGTVRLDLEQVVYVSAESDELRVGFG